MYDTTRQPLTQKSLFPLSENEPPSQKRYSIPVYTVTLVRERRQRWPTAQLRSSRETAQLLYDYLGDTDREHFVVIMLDTKNKVIGINTVSTGSLTASIVHPREVFKPAILSNANAIICGHNHPSGAPAPSAEDRALTTRLVAAGKTLGILMFDHVVIGDGTTDYYSFADEGML